jgi:hypothetical protein
MKVNKSGRNDFASSVDGPIAGRAGAAADFRYLAVFDPEITFESWNPCSIDNRAPTDMDIEIFH